MTKKLLVALISTILISSNTSADDNFRIATVDVNRIMNELDVAKDKKAEIDKRSKGMKEKIQKERTVLKAIEDKLKAKKPSPDSKEVEDFRAKARNFERLVKDSEEELRREFLKVNKLLTERVLTTVQGYAQKNHIKIVFDKSAPGRSPVLYGVTEADITSDVLRELNK